MYRSLLVCLDDRPPCDARVDVAMALARRFDAHLVGLAPSGVLQVPIGLDGAAAMAELMGDLRSAAERSARRFAERCEAARLASVETLVDEAPVARSVVGHARCSDLVIVGQAEAAAERDAVEQVVLQCARPVLVVPFAGRFDTVGERVLVAWNDSPEAARAVADAMPLLCRAERVLVVQCDTPQDDALVGEERSRRLEALRRWLMWHGVDAQVRQEATPIDTGNALLSMAADRGCDLMVMGAWGRPRWTERVMGGATRTLMDSMTLPVLMSH
jgi:nucleotide-binding universal stress UspA family protein